MLDLYTEIDIDAPAKHVEAILMDSATYPLWNPFIKAIAGQPQPGARLTVTLQPSGSKAMQFTAKILSVRRCELCWRGRLFVPGLLDGEHRLAIKPCADGTTRFSQDERFSGLLLGFMRASLERDTRRGFKATNEALKARAERTKRLSVPPVTPR